MVKLVASLKAIPRWDNRLVPTNYLLLAATTGMLWFDALLRLFGAARLDASTAAAAVIVLAWTAKSRYWSAIDRAASAATAGSATRLGGANAVRFLESPHTTANYLLREMGYVVAPKHARKLRRTATSLAFMLPFILEMAAVILPTHGATAAACLAAVVSLIGVVIECWLFFAEAEHVVTLYYGKSAV